MTTRPRTNWAGNIAFGAPDFHRPSSLGELQAVVARARCIRVLATGHSFNDMADSPGAQVTLAGMPAEVSVDSARSVARVAAGLSYAEVAARLDTEGFALRNLASLPHISVAGGCATATHGSGAANQNLASAVGTFALHPAAVVRPVSAPRLLTDLEQKLELLGETGVVAAPRTWTWSRPSTSASGSARDLPLDNLDVGVPGRWHERLPHFRPEFKPSVGDELQSEYLLPVARAVPALHALNEIRDRLAPVLRICEIRVAAADDLWLSTCYHRDSVAFHFTWIADTAAVLPVITDLERQLAAFAPRPHWGKVFTTPPEEFRSSYERLPDFLALMHRLDPTGKFGNSYTTRNLGA